MTQVEQTQAGLRLRGVLDVRGVATVRPLLHTSLDATDGDLVVDVSDLDALDATGLALLVATHRRATSQGRRLVLDEVRPPLARLLAVTRLNRVLVVRRPRTTSRREPGGDQNSRESGSSVPRRAS